MLQQHTEEFPDNNYVSLKEDIENIFKHLMCWGFKKKTRYKNYA